MCDIDDKVLNLFADAFSVNLSVQRLDLSYNFIADKHGDIIAKIISNQTQCKDS
jgi:hypothetical protein